MKNHNLHFATSQPPPSPPRDDDDAPTYEEVHNDGNSGYGNSED